MRHAANKSGIPDHLINTMAAIMSGQEMGQERIPFHAKEVYQEQEEIGWQNMTRGRIPLRWGEVRRANPTGKKDPEKRWRTALIKITLRWTHERWLLRCQLYQEPEEELELQGIFKECSECWETRRTRGLHQTDAYMKGASQAPKILKGKDYLREWLKTRRIAEEAYRRYRPDKTQPTLHRWLVHRE